MRVSRSINAGGLDLREVVILIDNKRDWTFLINSEIKSLLFVSGIETGVSRNDVVRAFVRHCQLRSRFGCLVLENSWTILF